MTNKILTIIASSLILFSFSSVGNANKNQLGQETVNVKRFGLTFRKPDRWFNGNAGSITKNLKKLDSNKEKVSKLLASHRRSLLIATFAKYDPSKYRDIIPTINVLILPNPHKEFSAFLRSMKLSSQSMSKILNNYKQVKEVSEIAVSGKKAVYFIAEFDINVASGKVYRVKNITYMIPFDDAFIQVSMSESAPAKTSELFSDFINSFAFKK